MIADADGGRTRRISAPPEEAFHPVWSPEGRRIAYAVLDENRKASFSFLAIVDLETGAKRVLARDGLFNTLPCWSPRGDRIALKSSHDLRDSFVLRICTVREGALGLASGDPWDAFLLAAKVARLDETSRAREKFREAARRLLNRCRDHATLSLAAKIAMDLKEIEIALSFYEGIPYSLLPNQKAVENLIGLALCRFHLGDRAGAIQAAEQCLQFTTKEKERKGILEGIEKLKRIESLEGEIACGGGPETYMQLAALNHRLDRDRPAFEHYYQAARLFREPSKKKEAATEALDAWDDLVKAKGPRQEGVSIPALEEMLYLVHDQELPAEALVLLARAYMAERDFPSAMAALDRIDPADLVGKRKKTAFRSCCRIAEFYLDSGEIVQAEAALRRLSELKKIREKDYPASLAGKLGALYLGEGKLEEAARWYGRVLLSKHSRHFEAVSALQGLSTIIHSDHRGEATRTARLRQAKYFMKARLYPEAETHLSLLAADPALSGPERQKVLKDLDRCRKKISRWEKAIKSASEPKEEK
jgi:tetratricopeptide (TPR) repeat protein